MLIVFFVTAVVVVLIVAMQLQGLLLISEHLPRLPFRHIFRVTAGLLWVIALHIFSIIIFAVTILALEHYGLGDLQGDLQEDLTDYLYFSFATYSTVGYGDIVPVGPVRFIAQVESLVGLVLIACSASYVFVFMEDYWKSRKKTKLN